MQFQTGQAGVFASLIIAASAFYNEEPCRGEGYYCTPTSGGYCPGDTFLEGGCPTQPSDIMCCTSVPFDEPECDATGGNCLDDRMCHGGDQVSGLCPSQPDGVRCCVSCADDTCSDSVAQALACDILALHEAGQVDLKTDHFDPNGNSPYDGAAVYDNIKDTCDGYVAKRSSYGNAPGGCICLKREMLQTLYDYAFDYWGKNGVGIMVNALAGSSHSVNSYHYYGGTMDVQCDAPVYHCEELTEFCRDRGAIELCYPGSACGGHETWVHCAMAA